MSKFTAILLTLPLFFLGCGKPSSINHFTITMSLGEQEWKIFRESVFPPFEEKHNVMIHAYQIESGQLAAKLEALQTAGSSEIDLFAQDNMNLALLISKDLVIDLSNQEQLIPENIIFNLISSCIFDDKLMFMPFRPNVQIVYYNEQAFSKYGMAPPRTWDELLFAAQAFKKGEGEGKILLKAFGGNPTATQLYEFILQAGGDPYTFNDNGCVKAFTFLQKLWPYVTEESRRAKWDTTNEIIARQQAYLGQNWPFSIVVLIQQYKLPFIKTYSGWKGPAGEHHVIGGDVFGIPKNAKNKELALAFIRYIHSKEIQELLVSQLGWPSMRQDVYGTIDDWQKPHYKAVMEAMKHGSFRKNVTWWPVYAKYISEAFGDIVIEKKPVKETLTIYKETLEKEKITYK